MSFPLPTSVLIAFDPSLPSLFKVVSELKSSPPSAAKAFILATKTPRPGFLCATACVNLPEEFVPQTEPDLRFVGDTSHPRDPAKREAAPVAGCEKGVVKWMWSIYDNAAIICSVG